MKYPDLTHIKPGDQLAVPYFAQKWNDANEPRVNHQILTVDRVTETQIIARDGAIEVRVRRADGQFIGRAYCSAMEATAAIVDAHIQQVAARARYSAALARVWAVEDAISRRKLTTEAMEAIAAAFDKFNPATPKN